MKPKTIILMVVAVVCGLSASYMTSQLLQKDETPPEAAPLVKVPLLVAKKNLDIHTALRAKPEDYFVEKLFIEEEAPKDGVKPADSAKLKGKYLKRPLRKQDHVTLDDLLDTVTNLRTLPPGMRAVGIQVKASEIAGGFASLPGSHVDIVWTTRGGGGTDTFSKVLLEDVVVLAADGTDQHQGGGALPASVVTVALKPEDAVTLAVAMENGSVRLLLRNHDDQGTNGGGRVTLGNLHQSNIPSTKDRQQEQPPLLAGPVENPREPSADRGDRPMATPRVGDPEEQPKEQPKLHMEWYRVANGTTINWVPVWFNEEGNVVAAPQARENEPIPQPAFKEKKN